MADLLAAKITEWVNTVEAATIELRLLKGQMHPGETYDDLRGALGVAVQEVRSDLDCAMIEMEAMAEAMPLLEHVAEQLDAENRSALAKALHLICGIDWATRTDFLAGEVRELRELRTGLAVN